MNLALFTKETGVWWREVRTIKQYRHLVHFDAVTPLNTIQCQSAMLCSALCDTVTPSNTIQCQSAMLCSALCNTVTPSHTIQCQNAMQCIMWHSCSLEHYTVPEYDAVHYVEQLLSRTLYSARMRCSALCGTVTPSNTIQCQNAMQYIMWHSYSLEHYTVPECDAVHYVAQLLPRTLYSARMRCSALCGTLTLSNTIQCQNAMQCIMWHSYALEHYALPEWDAVQYETQSIQ